MRASLVAILTALLLALPGAAFAVTPSDDVYLVADNEPGVTSLADDGDGDGSGLPFTGLDVAIVALAGAAILGTGIGIRRAGRSD